MSGRCRLYSSGPSHFAAVLGCKAALSYPSPSVEGEGDRAKRGGGEEARPPNFPSTMLRMVPLPTLRVGRIMDGPHLPIPYPRIVPVSMNRWCHARASPGSIGDCNPYARSEEHTSELQSLMRNSYAVFCLKKTNTTQTT